MSAPKFIADRIFSLSKENLSSTVMRLAVTSVALAIIVMLIAWAVVVGFKNQIRDKVIGFVAPIHVQALDMNESVEETPFVLDSLLISRLNSIEGISHYQMVANKAGMIKTDDEIQGVVLKGVDENYDWTYFKNCLLDGEMTDAVGLFKSENKDSFLKVQRNGDKFEILQELGININKLDKGCLIFNTNKEDGYVVSVVDNSNRGEAKYWVEDFLQVKRKNDSYTQTQNAMTMCKSFISQLPSDIDKADKAAMMNRVVEGLKQESVSIDSVASKAFGPELSAGFNSFRNEYQETHDVRFDESFQGKPESIKRRAVGTITTIKLDKNFDVNIHGGEQYIERGYDEDRGMKYYKLFFNEEK